MTEILYDSKDNEVVLCTNDDFDIITLYTGKYYGNELLDIGFSIDDFSHLILITEEINPKVLIAHIIPTFLMITTNPYEVNLKDSCYIYLYKNDPQKIWVGNLGEITSGCINKIYGVKKP